MKLLSFSVDNEEKYGAIVSDGIIDLHKLFPELPDEQIVPQRHRRKRVGVVLKRRRQREELRHVFGIVRAVALQRRENHPVKRKHGGNPSENPQSLWEAGEHHQRFQNGQQECHD